MTGIFIHGIGAVSPAGWSVADLRAALERNLPLPAEDISCPGRKNPLKIRNVPPPQSRPAFFLHPRLRRATSVAQFSVSAALEAIGSDAAKVSAGELSLGIVIGELSGCVNYSRRFYEEVLREPATASPMIFPETVFNSAASHLGAFLNTGGISYTIVGDDGAFLQGLALAAQWLEDGKVDACVVVGAEESDWVSADAIRLFERKTIHGAGAGAIYLKKNPAGAAAKLSAITDSFSFTSKQSRAEAERKMRAQLPENSFDGNFSNGEIKSIFGEAFVASAAWACLAACDAVAQKRFPGTNIRVTGANQQVIGARFAEAIS